MKDVENDKLEPLADALQMDLSYEPPGFRKIKGRMRFSVEAEPKLRISMTVLESFEDKKAEAIVLLLQVSKKLFMVVSRHHPSQDLVIRLISSEKLGVALDKTKIFSMFSSLDGVIEYLTHGILASYILEGEKDQWERLE